MTKNAFKLFTILGFEVKLDGSWLILALLIGWSLGAGYFPYVVTGLPASTYWTLGALGSIGLFFSIVFHELCHSIVARRHNMEMRGITLFIFGGVAEMGDEAPNPRAEFMMAIAGPLSSFVLAAVFYGLARVSPPLLGVLLQALATMNTALAVFNLVPAFPLDGGRVLRSALWAWRKDLLWATRITTRIGVAFGTFLVVLGVASAVMGNLLAGMWRFVIGLFLQKAAQQSYAYALLRHTLQGQSAGTLMRTDVPAVRPDLALDDVVAGFFLRSALDWLPVVGPRRELLGCVRLEAIRNVPRHAWAFRTVADVMAPCDDALTIAPDMDVMAAASEMTRLQTSVLMVEESGRLAGLLFMQDLLRFVELHSRLLDKKPTYGRDDPVLPHPSRKLATQPGVSVSNYPHEQFHVNARR